MSTRAIIAAMQFNETFMAIYLHNDGDDAGDTLDAAYDNQAAVDKLLALGHLSELVSDDVVAYGRDRGETDQEAVQVGSLDALRTMASDMDAEYLYVWHPALREWLRPSIEEGEPLQA